MTQTMLERAARAARDAEVLWNPNVESLHACVARAVLMAVREPDEDLVGWVSGEYAREFTFMIDAILNEGEK